MSKENTQTKNQLTIDHTEKLSFHLSTFITQNLKSDFTLVVENQRVPVHRILLASRR